LKSLPDRARWLPFPLIAKGAMNGAQVNYRSTESAAHKIIGAQSDDVRADDFLMVLAPILRNDR
jgi:hypothetical protein